MFDPSAILEVLNRHGVRYVVIGAIAALAHGAPIPPTEDLDLTPARSRANLGHLSRALRELDARVWTASVPEGLPFSHDASSLARMQGFLNLVCAHGRFDLCFAPGGFPDGYRALIRHAVEVEVGSLRVMVASIDDIIASKNAAGREKDHRTLPALERWRRGL